MSVALFALFGCGTPADELTPRTDGVEVAVAELQPHARTVRTLADHLLVGCPDSVVRVLSDGERRRDPRIIVVCDRLRDDSVRAIRWDVGLTGVPGSYTVDTARRLHWCWDGRGLPGWRTSPCS